MKMPSKISKIADAEAIKICHIKKKWKSTLDN
jgi:hypothetical protein